MVDVVTLLHPFPEQGVHLLLWTRIALLKVNGLWRNNEGQLSKTEEKCKQSIGKNMRRKMIPCSHIFAVLLLTVYFLLYFSIQQNVL